MNTYSKLEIVKLDEKARKKLKNSGVTVLFLSVDGQCFPRKIKEPHGDWGMRSIKSIAKKYMLKTGQSIVIEYL